MKKAYSAFTKALDEAHPHHEDVTKQMVCVLLSSLAFHLLPSPSLSFSFPLLTSPYPSSPQPPRPCARARAVLMQHMPDVMSCARSHPPPFSLSLSRIAWHLQKKVPQHVLGNKMMAVGQESFNQPDGVQPSGFGKLFQTCGRIQFDLGQLTSDYHRGVHRNVGARLSASMDESGAAVAVQRKRVTAAKSDLESCRKKHDQAVAKGKGVDTAQAAKATAEADMQSALSAYSEGTATSTSGWTSSHTFSAMCHPARAARHSLRVARLLDADWCLSSDVVTNPATRAEQVPGARQAARAADPRPRGGADQLPQDGADAARAGLAEASGSLLGPRRQVEPGVRRQPAGRGGRADHPRVLRGDQSRRARLGRHLPETRVGHQDPDVAGEL